MVPMKVCEEGNLVSMVQRKEGGERLSQTGQRSVVYSGSGDETYGTNDLGKQGRKSWKPDLVSVYEPWRQRPTAYSQWERKERTKE